jgi:hypothetical protein
MTPDCQRIRSDNPIIGYRFKRQQCVNKQKPPKGLGDDETAGRTEHGQGNQNAKRQILHLNPFLGEVGHAAVRA